MDNLKKLGKIHINYLTNIVNCDILKEYRNGNKISEVSNMCKATAMKSICMFPGVKPNGTAKIQDITFDFVIDKGKSRTSVKLSSAHKKAFEQALRANGMPYRVYY